MDVCFLICLWPRVILLRPATAGRPEAFFCIVSIASLSFWRWGSKLPFKLLHNTLSEVLLVRQMLSCWPLNWGEGIGNGKTHPHSPLLLDDHIRVLEKQMVQVTCTVVHTNFQLCFEKNTTVAMELCRVHGRTLASKAPLSGHGICAHWVCAFKRQHTMDGLQVGWSPTY